MRAILVEHFDGAEAMRAGELEMPEPARDEILVRVLAAWAGPWDVEQRRGGWKGPLLRRLIHLRSREPALRSGTQRPFEAAPPNGVTLGRIAVCLLWRHAPVP
jgi:hypothetical protein